jgi:dihydroflavonol-4-reductase
MRVGVTGATGFLGSHLCRRLQADGHHVIALRRPTSDADDLAGLGVESFVGDVADRKAVADLVRACDAVVHAAAVLSYGRAFAGEHERVNVGGTRVVVDACRAAGVGRLLHVSSVAAIGLAADGRPADERFSSNLDGSGLSYHLSKERAEEVVRNAVGDGLDAVVVNPSTLAGPFGPRFRGGELPAGVLRRRIVPAFVGGSNVVHVEDVVAGALSALERGRTGERYILGGENLTWRRMAEIAAEELGVRRIVVPVPAPVTAVVSRVSPGFSRDRHVLASRHLYYDSSKAREELDYKFRPYREIVREYVEWRAGA